MATVELSSAADADLTAILRYSIAAHGRETAEAYLLNLDRAIERLAVYPELAPRYPHLRQQPLRCLPCGEHRIFYQFDGATVLIVRVLHHSMDVEQWLGR